MNIPESQSTKEKLNQSLEEIYSNIAKRYNEYALQWNGIWRVWRGISPTWGETDYGNFLHKEIPYEERFTNKKEFNNEDGEVNQNISALESYDIETIGNQNTYREDIRNFNNVLLSKFEEIEYTDAGESLYYKPIKSYGVDYIIENNEGIVKEHYYVKNYETFSQDYTYDWVLESNNERIYKYFDENKQEVEYNSIPKVSLYKDENLKSLATIQNGNPALISLYKNGYHYYIVWTGERYYATKQIDQYDRIMGEEYTAPTDLTSNDSKGLTVYNETLKSNTYKLFNGSENNELRTDISSSKPEIITFNLDKSLNIIKYTIQAENSYGSYPMSWTIQGSNDNKNWSVIHEKRDEEFSVGGLKEYMITNNTYYLYYRMVITKFHNVSVKNTSSSFIGRRIGSLVEKALLRKFTFSGHLSFTSVNDGRIQPQNLGNLYSGNMDGIKTYAESMEGDEKDYQHFSKFKKTDVPNTSNSNLTDMKVYDRSTPIVLNTSVNGIRQDNIIRKEDYLQMERVLDKINSVLKLRDSWFDNYGRCSLSCQVQCQSGCQVSCQYCNTHQCHNQKCGTH